MRVLVVGASSGIGREIALAAAAGGADVAVAARRGDRLAEVVERAGGGHAITGDVSRPDHCARIVAEAASALGGFDLVVYAVGIAPLKRLEDLDPDEWRQVFDANVGGLQQVIRAVLPHLAPHAVVAVLSSESVVRPWTGLGAYSTSKAALEQLVRAWRIEHPEVRFCTLTIGATHSTGFADDFDPEVLGGAMETWVRHGLLQSQQMEPAELAGFVVAMLSAALMHPGIGVEQLTLRAPSDVA